MADLTPSLFGASSGGNTVNASPTTGNPLVLPEGCEVGDLHVVIASTNSNTATLIDVGGYTIVTGPVIVGNMTAYVLSKTLTQADILAGSYTATWSVAGRPEHTGAIWVDTDSAGPITAFASTTTTSTSTVTFPTVTSTGASQLLIAAVAARVSDTTVPIVGYGAGYLPAAATLGEAGSGVNLSTALGSGEAGASYSGGSAQPTNATLSATATNTISFSIALKGALAPVPEPETSFVKGISIVAEANPNFNERFYGDPGAGKLYFGESQNGGDPSSMEALAGKRVGCFRIFAQGIPDAINTAERDYHAGRLPFISIKPSEIQGGATWQSIANGDQDAQLITLRDGLQAIGGPMLLAVNHEPENDVNGSTLTAATFVAMSQHITQLFSSASRVSYTLILMSGKHNSHKPAGYIGPISDWATADSCDVFGMDGYRRGTDTPAEVYGDAMNGLNAVDPTKAIVVGEWSCLSPTQSGKPVGSAAQYMQDFYDYCVQRGDVAAVSWYNNGTNWTLDPPSGERYLKWKDLLLNGPANVFQPIVP